MTPEKFTANGWTAVLPDGWEDRSMITLVGETGASGFAANIVVTRQKIDSETSLEDYAAIQGDMMRNEVGNLQILDERAIEINGAPAFQRLQRFLVNESQ
ncbi:MAG: DcrB-related protein, partial [Pyrinomonadaceae bacterium]